MINSSPTPDEIAAEAREALSRMPPRTPRQHFRKLVRLGWINAQGQVTKFLGGEAEPEPDYQTWTKERPPQKKKKTG